MDTIEIKKKLHKLDVAYIDVDGTFVNNGCLFRNREGYTLKNASAIYELLNAGVDVVMTTSRTKEQLKEIARLLGFKNYICEMGCEIVYNNGERVLKNYGNIKSEKDLNEWIESTGIVELFLERHKGKIRYYAPWASKVKTHPLLVGELDFEKVHTWIDEKFPQLRIVDNGRVPPEEDFKAPHAYHILPKNVGKKTAIAMDKKERCLKKENLIAVGNSMEDMIMADEVGIYFALDYTVETDRENIVYIENTNGEGFGRMVQILKDTVLI